MCAVVFLLRRKEMTEGKQLTAWPEITTVNTGVAPRTCKAEATGPCSQALGDEVLKACRSSCANPSGALPGSVWLPWALTGPTGHPAESTTPRCKTTDTSGASH